jgi:CRP/FNR family cyclic AMP-dependent transcriptional regulator
MSEKGILGVFAGHEFLRGLSERHLMILASGAKPFTAGPGELLARQDETADAFYLIRSGHVVIGAVTPAGDEVSIQQVGPGEVVGWSWLVAPHRWQFSCRAADRVEGIAFDAAWLRDLCERDPGLGYHLLKQMVTVMAERLASTRRQLVAPHQEFVAHAGPIP